MPQFTFSSFRRRTNSPAFLGYLMLATWFLLTIMASTAARGETIGVEVAARDILPDIESALVAKGAPANGEIVLHAPDARFVVTSPVEFAHVSYAAGSGRFVIRLKDAPVPVAGVVKTAERAPVLSRAVERGEIISENDIIYVEDADLRGGRYARDASALIGKAARRPLRAHAPIRASDVVAPVLVKKGALVTLAYSAEGLKLTHQGVAMNAGAQGDVVAIKNTRSQMVLKGVVEAENLVVVVAPRAAL